MGPVKNLAKFILVSNLKIRVLHWFTEDLVQGGAHILNKEPTIRK
jgi:hypothetical protein